MRLVPQVQAVVAASKRTLASPEVMESAANAAIAKVRNKAVSREGCLMASNVQYTPEGFKKSLHGFGEDKLKHVPHDRSTVCG
jgi:hypothetical protein